MSDWEEDSSPQYEETSYSSSYNSQGRTRGGRGGRSSGREGPNRSSDSWRDGGGEPKFNGDSVTINVESSYLGRIIGRGGSKIKELEEDSGARIKVSRDDNTVTLSGSSDAQQRAKSLIEEITSGSSNFGGRRGDSESYSRGAPDFGSDAKSGFNSYGRKNDFDDNDSPTTISVDSSFLGRIIGRGGSKIRELEDNSGARIKVSRDDNSVTLTGSAEAQKKAKELIDDICGGDGRQNSFKSASNVSNTSASYGNSTADSPAPIIDWDEVNRQHELARAAHLAKLPPMIKNFYSEAPEVANMSPEQVEEFRLKNNNIQVQYVFGKSENQRPVPNPVWTFEQAFHNYPEILEEIRKQGFEKPSPIQCQAWPILLSGQDLIGISQTGSGKTLAFLLPGLIHIDNQPVPRSQRGGPNILVLAPTRELALQIEKEVNKYSYKNIKCVCVYGGGDRRAQMNMCNKGVEIIIATPGRLNDLVAAGVIDVTSVTYLILDEADRMLDMGFEPQIRKTLFDVRPDRQTVMTSATWPEGVRRLAQSYMKDPIQVFIGTLDLAACHSVTQIIEIIPEEDKPARLNEFFQSMTEDDKAIVFVGKKMRADDLSSELCLAGVNVQSIHGDREQSDREQALEDIKSGEVRILIATDVASRGIDIGDITHIINYDFPRNIEEYVHRVGRTGRAGRTGTAITFFTRSDWGHAKELIPILEEAGQNVPEELFNMVSRHDAWKERRAREKDQERYDAGGGGGGGRFGGGGGGRFGGRDRDGGGGGGWGGGGRRNKW